jgi:predicted trehalose synthase
MNLSRPSGASARKGLIATLKWVVSGGLLVALIMAVVQCSVERQSARHATVQTYNLSRVAAFRDSGADLDRKVAAFADAAAEGRDLSGPREAFRSALADHSAKTFAMKDAFGADATQPYVEALKNLQSAVEGTTDQHNSGAIITALSRTVVLRNKLSDEVTKKATA